MATIFGLTPGTGSYPEGGPFFFGINSSAHASFITPVAKFEFFAPNGETSSAPTIYVRMGGSFNTALLNNYTEQSGIFGSVNATQKGALETLSTLGSSGMDALQAQILKGVAEAAGFIGSAGMNGRRQVEFLQRRLINEFQQLVYTGPTFRRFQLPFAMKPTSKSEAESMLKIIQTFRVASSPKAQGGGLIDAITEADLPDNILDESTNPEAAAQIQNIQNIQTFNEQGAVLAGEEDVLTFTYPEMCKFSLLLYKGNAGIGELATLFQSDFCMIESVSVDYGSQNKMTFFNGDEYYPTDVNLTIALREAVLVTAQKATNDFVAGRTIL